jgi:hypothetical protein
LLGWFTNLRPAVIVAAAAAATAAVLAAAAVAAAALAYRWQLGHLHRRFERHYLDVHPQQPESTGPDYVNQQ